MAIPRAQEDSWTKEMSKWEMRPVMVNGTYVQPLSVADGGRAGAAVTEFPKMIYRGESADGGPRIAGCKIVANDADERMALGSGWSVTQEAALAQVTAQQLEFAKLAANRAHNDRWMSDKAKAEARAIDETTMEHLPEIPRTAIRKRRTKAEMAAAKG